jgi:hypothetical protein
MAKLLMNRRPTNLPGISIWMMPTMISSPRTVVNTTDGVLRFSYAPLDSSALFRKTREKLLRAQFFFSRGSCILSGRNVLPRTVLATTQARISRKVEFPVCTSMSLPETVVKLETGT